MVDSLTALSAAVASLAARATGQLLLRELGAERAAAVNTLEPLAEDERAGLLDLVTQRGAARVFGREGDDRPHRASGHTRGVEEVHEQEEVGA